MRNDSSPELPSVNPEDIRGIPFAWQVERRDESRLIGVYDPFDAEDCRLYDIACRNFRDRNHQDTSTVTILDGDGYVAVGLFIDTLK